LVPLAGCARRPSTAHPEWQEQRLLAMSGFPVGLDELG